MSANPYVHFAIWSKIFLLLACFVTSSASEEAEFTELLGLYKIHAQIETQISALCFDRWCKEHFSAYDARHLCSKRNKDCQKGIEMAACCIWKRLVQSYLDNSNLRMQLYLLFNLQKCYLAMVHSKSLYWMLYKYSWMENGDIIEPWQCKLISIKYETSSTPLEEPLQNFCDDIFPNDACDSFVTIKDQKHLAEAEMQFVKVRENYEFEPDAIVQVDTDKVLQQQVEIQDNEEKSIMDMTKTELQIKLSALGINFPKKDNKEKLRKRLESAQVENKKQEEIDQGYQETRDYFLSFTRDGFVDVLNHATPIITGSKEGYYQSTVQGRADYVYKNKYLVLQLTYEDHPYRLLSIYENVIVYQTIKKGQFIEKNFIYLVYETVTEDATEIIKEEPFKQFIVNVKRNSIEEISVHKFKITSKIQNQLLPGSTYSFETFVLL